MNRWSSSQDLPGPVSSADAIAAAAVESPISTVMTSTMTSLPITGHHADEVAVISSAPIVTFPDSDNDNDDARSQ